MNPPSPPTTHEVINQAIRENKFGEYLLYGFSAIFVVGGLGVLIAAVTLGREVHGIVGGLAATLFYPAMNLARKMRELNMAIRLLEIPLNNSETAEEAATILQEFFQSRFRDDKGKTSATRKPKALPKKTKENAKGDRNDTDDA